MFWFVNKRRQTSLSVPDISPDFRLTDTVHGLWAFLQLMGMVQMVQCILYSDTVSLCKSSLCCLLGLHCRCHLYPPPTPTTVLPLLACPRLHCISCMVMTEGCIVEPLCSLSKTKTKETKKDKNLENSCNMWWVLCSIYFVHHTSVVPLLVTALSTKATPSNCGQKSLP